MRHTHRNHLVEKLEPRSLLAAQVTLDAGVLRIVGDDTGNVVDVSLAVPTIIATPTVQGGTTSVALDTETLASAAGLTLASVSTTGTAAEGYDVGFPILGTSTLSYTVRPFAPLGGVIQHSGTVTFTTPTGSAVTVGNFEVAFDPNRVDENRSGFYVRDTVGTGAILFDVSTPSSATIDRRSLVLAGDLLVSPEFASFLQNGGLATTDLTGATVGTVQVNATTDIAAASQYVVDVNGDVQSFPAVGVSSIEITMGAGNDDVTLLKVDRPAVVTLGAGNDLLTVFRGQGALNVDAGAGRDRIVLIGSTFNNSVLLNGGTGSDSLVLVNTTLPARTTRGLERRIRF